MCPGRITGDRPARETTPPACLNRPAYCCFRPPGHRADDTVYLNLQTAQKSRCEDMNDNQTELILIEGADGVLAIGTDADGLGRATRRGMAKGLDSLARRVDPS